MGFQRYEHISIFFIKFIFKPPSGIYATSRHIPGVRFAGVSHPGLIGTAPSAELLATWNKRETALIAEHANAIPPVAFPPEPIGAYVGQELSNEVMHNIAREGARTIPGREHGGNCDVRSIFSSLD
jgi:formamidase